MGFATLVSGYTLVPLSVLINRARRLMNAGFGHQDIGVAFKAEIERSREERAYGLGHGGKASLLERILRWISVPSLATAVITLPFLVTLELQGAGLFVVGQLFGWSLALGVGTGVGALIMLQRRRDVDAEFWGRLWTGRLGRWLFGFARMFTSKKALPASLTHRPTELALGMAAEQLYRIVAEGVAHPAARSARRGPSARAGCADDARATRGASGSARGCRAARQR
jgi:hypothetical protein